MSPITLTGLDAQNPLAFFAALGLLRILDEHARAHNIPRPKLSFADVGYATPTLNTSLSWDEITRVILDDAQQQAHNAALRLAYNDAGEQVPPDAANATCDLKPTPQVARACLDDTARAATDAYHTDNTHSRRAVDLLASFFSELVQDNNGNTKPTSLHFTAGQQAFLAMVEALRAHINADDIQEALIGPWKNLSDDRKLPSLSWDASVSRAYALRASDPSKDKKSTIAGANWLAVQALTFFPVCAQRGRLVTTRVKGGWKDSVFTWPLWGVPATAPVVASLLRVDPLLWSARERQAIGVIGVFSSQIQRSDQGGYGSFTPAACAFPPPRGRAR